MSPQTLPPIPAAILAGGASRRMGSPKALLQYEGETLIVRTAQKLRPLFRDVIVVTGSAEIPAVAHLPAVPDTFAGKGPLAGIHAALLHFNLPVFCFACDMPYLNRDFIGYMLTIGRNFDVVVPQAGNFFEPLHAIYSPACLPHFEAELKQDSTRSMQQIIRERNTFIISEAEARHFDTTLQMFENWNTPGDLAKGVNTQI